MQNKATMLRAAVLASASKLISSEGAVSVMVPLANGYGGMAQRMFDPHLGMIQRILKQKELCGSFRMNPIFEL